MERPILFSGPMVQAILEGRKTQTRRVVNPQRTDDSGWLYYDRGRKVYAVRAGMSGIPMQALLSVCPYGHPGDRLWVRETWVHIADEFDGMGDQTYYRASGPQEKNDAWLRDHDLRWRPSIHMPRWASRITLEITGVRVERVQSISLDDMRAEGVRPNTEVSLLWRETLAQNFRDLWDSINAKRGYGWDTNCWVWVVEFRRLT